MRHVLQLLSVIALAFPLVGHGQGLESAPNDLEPSAPADQGGIVRFLSESTHGAVEMGVMYGRPPFSAEATDAWNIIGHGSLQLVLFGVPITSTYEFGSYPSTRGAQNRVRVSVDTDKLKELIQLRDARRLEDARSHHDSLQLVLEQDGHSILVDTSASPAHLPQQGMQAISFEAHESDVDSLRLIEDRSIGELSRPTLPSIAVDTGVTSPDAPDPGRTVLATAERAQERAEAIVAMDMDRSIGGRFLMGLRRMELGSLTPNGSEFLLNGLSLQGVGMEWASERFFFAFDHGSCLDDVWRSASISADRLRRVQESLFLVDAPVLDPRRLTVLRTGVGMPESSHVHVGLLRGRRSGLAYGAESPSSGEGSEMTNHVIEVDAAMAIKTNHLIRLVVARSLTSVDVGESAMESEKALGGGGIQPACFIGEPKCRRLGPPSTSQDVRSGLDSIVWVLHFSGQVLVLWMGRYPRI